MRQAYRILPVYTGDVSGVCSALYELGGMVVMHDPSGCNSTYNTHDEIRWYRQDSLIFLSGLCEPDAIMGNDEKFIEDVIRAAKEYSPAFIALCNSPIPYLTGTDFAGICSVLEKKTGIPAFYIPTNGIHDYINGAGLAFLKLAEKLFADIPDQPGDLTESKAASAPKERSLNILGMTPLDYAAPGSCESLRELLEREGWTVRSVWAMGDSLKDLQTAPEAGVNLVVSASGLRLALYLHEKFGIPWTAGVPAGAVKERVLSALDRAYQTGVCETAYAALKPPNPDHPSVIVIGEPVAACSIAAQYEEKGMSACVLSATEESEMLIRPGDRICRGEEEMELALKILGTDCRKVVADPLYRYICPAGLELEPVPHLAFSGRIYRKDFINPFLEDNT